MKIGLVTIFQVSNYGSVLQAFATEQVLNRMGHVCRIVNYTYPNKWHESKGAQRKKNSLKGLLGYLLGLTPYYRRLKHLSTFRKHSLTLTKRYPEYGALCNEDWSEYDCLAVGSDQVWNTRFQLGDPTFLLKFTKHSMRKISIASSFASKSVGQGFEKEFRDELSTFDFLSVREKNGVDIINTYLQIKKSVDVLLDPTLLLSSSEWIQAIKPQHSDTRKPYILWYVLFYAFEARPYIFEVCKYFQQKMGIETVIALEGFTPYENCQIKMKNAEDSSIPEYLALFQNAELVITSSFHGTAFAVNFGKPLISVVPRGDADDRQSTLLKSLGLESCIASIHKDFFELNPYYNFDIEQKNLEYLRKQSLVWIRNATKQ